MREGLGFDGVMVQNNNIECYPKETENSADGAGVGIFVSIYSTGVPTGAFLKNFKLSNTLIKADGGYIVFIDNGTNNVERKML